MTISFALGTYFIIWWVVLFAVLPWGVRSQVEEGTVVAGSEPGAPMRPLLLKKAIWTTIISAVIFAIFYVLYVNDILDRL